MIAPPPGKYDENGKINKHIVKLDTLYEAEIVAQYYKSFSAMQYVNISRKKPGYKKKGFSIKTIPKAEMSPTLEQMSGRLSEVAPAADQQKKRH
jgi:hypothetical protein